MWEELIIKSTHALCFLNSAIQLCTSKCYHAITGKVVISIYELLLFKSDLLINSICGSSFRYTVLLRNCGFFCFDFPQLFFDTLFQ